MTEARFTNRELQLKFDAILDTLHQHSDFHKEVLEQVKYTNGRVRKLYLYMSIIGSVVATLLFTNGSEVLNLIKLII